MPHEKIENKAYTLQSDFCRLQINHGVNMLITMLLKIIKLLIKMHFTEV